MTEINTTLLPDFIIEAGEHLDEIEALLLHLGEDPEDLEVLNDIFRPVHNIKGGAQITGLVKVSALAHRLEDLLDLLRQGQKTSNAEIVDLLIDARDRIVLLVNELERTQEELTPVDDLVDRLTFEIEREDVALVAAPEIEVEPEIIEFQEAESQEDQLQSIDEPDLIEITAFEQEDTLSSSDDTVETVEISLDSEESGSTDEFPLDSQEQHFDPDAGSKAPLLASDLDVDYVTVRYDEEQDSELFCIFLDHLHEQVVLLRQFIPQLQNYPSEDLLQQCSESVSSLWMAANYMGYDELSRLFSHWRESLVDVGSQIRKGEPVNLEFISDELSQIDSLFPQLASVMAEKSTHAASDELSMDDDIDREADYLSEALSQDDESEADVTASVLDAFAQFDDPKSKHDENSVTSEELPDESIVEEETDYFEPVPEVEVEELEAELNEPLVPERIVTADVVVDSAEMYEEDEDEYTDEDFANINMALVPDFIVEAMEHLDEIETLLLQLGEDPNNLEVLNDIFRPVHNIKGGSQITGLKKISRLAHRWEDLLDMLRQGEKESSADVVDLLIDTRDRIVQLVNELEQSNREVSSVSELVRRLTRAIDSDQSVPETPSANAAVPTTAGIESSAKMESTSESKDTNDSFEYDEENDQELFSIFLDHVEGQLRVIQHALKRIPTSETAENEFAAIYESLDGLWNAANYMGYEQLKDHYRQWGDEVDRARQSCVAGGYADPDFIQPYIDSLIDLFPQLEGYGVEQDQEPSEPAYRDMDSPVTAPKGAAPAENSKASELEERLLAALDSSTQPKANTESLNQIYDELVSNGPEQKPVSQESAAKKPPGRQSMRLEQKAGDDKRRNPGEADRKIKKSMRVDAEKIDTLMNQVGELVVDRSYFFQLFNEMRGLQSYLKDVPGIDQKDIKMVRTLTYRLGEAIAALGRTSNELQEGVMKMRMLPVSHIFNRYPRLVRDLTHGTDKKVNLVIRGEDTELDKMIVEELSDPLIHIIRNAVDHGLESMDERKSKGKTEAGILSLEAYQESNHIVIEVVDDGRGIDPDKIKRKALEKGLVTIEELERMAPRDITQMILAPGFSTAEKITGTSGRGVGMDVVKRNIEKLNGTLDIDSKPGIRTMMRLKIPLTLAIIHALMVRVGKDLFTIPLANVDETVRIFGNETSMVEGVEVIHLRGRALPMFRLSKLFNISGDVDSEKSFVVIVSTEGQRTGFVVDELIGQEEVVIKPLADYVQEKSGFSGATIVGDGRISLILDAYELVKMTANRQARKHKAQAIELKSRIRNKPRQNAV
ncbi:MAG: Hpt domain-containing protein [Gammaproteobacteria bacterium]|nr:Hpt domain-containing protein [Gammaproteobacteria bacterium]MDH5800711.1 Hpt domain-containing protein [Gammaproteobacteria bacterium]